MDLDFWSPGFAAPSLFGRERLSTSSAADSPSSISITDLAESVTSESATYSPIAIKPDPDDVNQFASSASPVGSSATTRGALHAPAPMSSRNGGTSTSAGASTIKAEEPAAPGKRGRGRPRKTPIDKVAPSEGKVNHGRSKTGCVTCRKRKKKCDEAKPGCMNCKKNNVACEGYKTPAPWYPGRQKSGGKSKGSELPPLVDGIQNELDSFLYNHFCNELSEMLYLSNGTKETPINNIIMPLTLKDPGLMHAVLCLAGYKLTENAPASDMDAARQKEVLERTMEHGGAALNLLWNKNLDNEADDPTVAQIMMLCLRTIMTGDCTGEYRFHLKPLRQLILSRGSQSNEFQRFAEDFLMFHSACSSITCTPTNRLPCYFPESFKLPDFVPPEAGSYFGILDGLFLFLHEITELRDQIRERRAQGLDPPVDFKRLHAAQQIDCKLREWTCHQPEGTTLETASLLYHRCTWIYLHRTILPSKPDRNLRDGVEEGVRLLKSLRAQNSVQAILVMPLFLLGCSAFDPKQRPEISASFDVLQAKRGAANIGHARTVVEAMWRLMDDESEASWDWEALMSSMHLDFLLS